MELVALPLGVALEWADTALLADFSDVLAAVLFPNAEATLQYICFASLFAANYLARYVGALICALMSSKRIGGLFFLSRGMEIASLLFLLSTIMFIIATSFATTPVTLHVDATITTSSGSGASGGSSSRLSSWTGLALFARLLQGLAVGVEHMVAFRVTREDKAQQHAYECLAKGCGLSSLFFFTVLSLSIRLAFPRDVVVSSGWRSAWLALVLLAAATLCLRVAARRRSSTPLLARAKRPLYIETTTAAEAEEAASTTLNVRQCQYQYDENDEEAACDDDQRRNCKHRCTNPPSLPPVVSSSSSSSSSPSSHFSSLHSTFSSSSSSSSFSTSVKRLVKSTVRLLKEQRTCTIIIFVLAASWCAYFVSSWAFLLFAFQCIMAAR